MRGLPLVRQLANRALRQHSTAAVVLATAAIGGAALACSPPARLAFRDLAREYRFAWKRTLMAYRTFASSQKGLVDSLVEVRLALGKSAGLPLGNLLSSSSKARRRPRWRPPHPHSILRSWALCRAPRWSAFCAPSTEGTSPTRPRCAD